MKHYSSFSSKKPHLQNQKIKQAKQIRYEKKSTKQSFIPEFSPSSDLSLSNRILLVSFTLLLLSTAAQAKRNQRNVVTYKYNNDIYDKTNLNNQLTANIQYDADGIRDKANVEWVYQAKNLTSTCERTKDGSCRVEAVYNADQLALRTIRYKTKLLPPAGVANNHYDVGLGRSCSLQGRISSFQHQSGLHNTAIEHYESKDYALTKLTHQLTEDTKKNIVVSAGWENSNIDATKVKHTLAVKITSDQLAINLDVKDVGNGKPIIISSEDDDESIVVNLSSSAYTKALEFPKQSHIEECECHNRKISCKKVGLDKASGKPLNRYSLFYQDRDDKTTLQLDVANSTVSLTVR